MTQPTELRVGMRVRDNEIGGRIKRIARLGDTYAWLEPVERGKFPRVARKRIHLDDKPRKSGWSIVR